MKISHTSRSDALAAAVLQAVTEARAVQTAREEATTGENAARPGPSIQAIRERLILLSKLRDMGMEIVRSWTGSCAPPTRSPGRPSPCRY